MSKKDMDSAVQDSEKTKRSNNKLKDFLGGSSNKEKMATSFGRSNSVAIQSLDTHYQMMQRRNTLLNNFTGKSR